MTTSPSEIEARSREFSKFARRYSQLGWALARLDGKRPVGRAWEKTEPDEPDFAAGRWSRWGERYGMGVVLGPSKLAVVEYDTETACEKLIELFGGELPLVPTVKSGGRSMHFYFRDEGYKAAARDGLELRAGAQQVVVPPSRHPETDKPYNWMLEPWGRELEPVPEAVLAYFTAGKNGTKVGPVAEEIPEGGRHRALLSIAGTLRRRGLTAEEIAVSLAAVNESRCRPPLPDEELFRLARDVARRYEPAPPDIEQDRIREEAVQLLSRAASRQPREKRQAPPLIVPLGDYLAGNQDEATWFVDWLAARAAITIFAGLPKVGKSTFAYGMLGALTASENGGTFIGLPVHGCAVLLLTEEPPATVEEKVDRFGLVDERVYVLPKRGARAGRSWPKLIDAVLEFCREHESVRVVVVDVLDKFADLTAKRSEADTGVIRETIDPLYPLLDMGVAVVLITHQRKEVGDFGLRVRGGTSLTGSADIIVEVERPSESAGLGREARVLKIVSRFAGTPDEIAVELGEDGWRSLGTVTAAVRRSRREDVLSLFGEGPLTLAELLDAAEGVLSRPTLQRRLRELVDGALVARLGEGVKGDPHRFQITEAGRFFCSPPEQKDSGVLPESQELSGFAPTRILLNEADPPHPPRE